MYDANAIERKPPTDYFSITIYVLRNDKFILFSLSSVKRVRFKNVLINIVASNVQWTHSILNDSYPSEISRRFVDL